MAYDLQQLGSTGFQDLAAALAVASFGPGVRSMGPGRDGGRDMYLKGQLVWQGVMGAPSAVWDGYTVFQSKHKRELAAQPIDNAAWLWGEIRSELDLWADPARKRSQVPDYLLFITNVPLSAVPDRGGHDQIRTEINSYIDRLIDDRRDVTVEDQALREAKLDRLRKVRAWEVWDGNDIQTLLNVHEGVRRGFKAFLTPADIFANLAQATDRLPIEELRPGLHAHARLSLLGESSIYFDEAGSGDAEPFPVHKVAIDLPVTHTLGTERSTVLNYVLDRAERVLKPELTSLDGPRHLIVTGAPGNGKTTISKFLVQIFRAAMVNGAEDLGTEHEKVIDGTIEALGRFGRELPRNRRWPIRIDLASYVQEGGLEYDSTLHRWIAAKVSARSNQGDITPRALHSWMKQWPWFLVLDGLDEVTDPAARKRLIQQVTEFVGEVEAEKCDVLVILTTRPTGYTENIAPTQFERIDLDYLKTSEAVKYGTMATRIRLRNDFDRIDKVVAQLNEAAEDESLRNLLRTPLQVLILTIIVDGSGHLAPDRYSLFWGYYETVFKRERGKLGGQHRMLLRYGQEIQRLHERIGFELQVRSELGERSFAALDHDELKQITRQVLDEAGYQPSGKDENLLEDIVLAATQRLVLIAPRGDSGYGFDVRSLQELMAAMRLTTGSAQQVAARLRIAAASPHWRNAWIFAAGRMFSSYQPDQQDAVLELIETIDQGAEQRLGSVVPIGPRLALEILDDGMVRQPISQQRLIDRGLKILTEPAGVDLPELTRMLVRFADLGDEPRRAVGRGIRDALSGGNVSKETATEVQRLIPDIASELGSALSTAALSRILKHPGKTSHSSDGSWTDFADEIATNPVGSDDEPILQEAATALERMRRTVRMGDVAAVQGATKRPKVAGALDAALAHIGSSEPKLQLALREQVLASIFREPVGGDLDRPRTD